MKLNHTCSDVQTMSDTAAIIRLKAVAVRSSAKQQKRKGSQSLKRGQSRRPTSSANSKA